MSQELQLLIDLEVPGLVDTIVNNTSDYYVKSYANNLLQRSYQDNPGLYLAVIERLINWYHEKIDMFRQNEYRYNVGVHEKSISVLQRLQELIEKEIH